MKVKNPRLHDARLEGRPVAGTVAATGKPPNRGGSMISAHHLQVAGCAVAAGEQSLGLMMREAARGEYRRRMYWSHNGSSAGAEQRIRVFRRARPSTITTLFGRSGNYLERHLRHIIDEIESARRWTIAIGIGHDVNATTVAPYSSWTRKSRER